MNYIESLVRSRYARSQRGQYDEIPMVNGRRRPFMGLAKNLERYGGKALLLGSSGVKQYESDLSNPLYLRVAKELGIKKLNSANDLQQVMDYLAGKGTKQEEAPKEEAPPDTEPEPLNEAENTILQIANDRVAENQQNIDQYAELISGLEARLAAADALLMGGYRVTVNGQPQEPVTANANDGLLIKSTASGGGTGSTTRRKPTPRGQLRITSSGVEAA